MVDRRILTGSELSVMTTFAAVTHAGVIKHSGGETGGDVTHRTIFRSGYMIRRLAYGSRAVVAGDTIAGDARVIEHGR